MQKLSVFIGEKIFCHVRRKELANVELIIYQKKEARKLCKWKIKIHLRLDVLKLSEKFSNKDVICQRNHYLSLLSLFSPKAAMKVR